MIIDMSQGKDGVWTYHDDMQASIAITVLLLTGWEITGFDDWLNTDSKWVEKQVNRDELVRLRHRLTETYHAYRKDSYVISLEAERLYAVAKWTSSHVAGYKIARRMQKYSEVQSDRRKGQTKLNDSQKRQIVREYEAALVKYGTIKSLARKFNVSDDTIKRVLDSK